MLRRPSAEKTEVRRDSDTQSALPSRTVTAPRAGGADAQAASEHEGLLDELVYGYTDEPGLIEEARRLVARRYLSEGYIEVSDITPEGVMESDVDPYHDTSAYFVAVDGSRRVVATIRQVGYDDARGIKSFPFCAHLELFDETWADLSGAPPEDWVELSGLAKEAWVDTSVANRLYREMWARSFAQGHEFWLIATHPRFARWLKGLFMSSVMTAGEPMEYLGSMTQPLLMQVVASLDGVCERYRMTTSERVRQRCRATAQYFLEGIDAAYFSPAQVRRFAEMGIEFSLDLRDGSLVSATT